MPQIVFICTKNQFRSPLAAAILGRELSARRVPGSWSVLSAGSWVQNRVSATPHALTEARKRGLDLSAHIAQGIEAVKLDQVDLFLTMEQGQKESILLDFPHLKGRVFLLSELTGVPFNIPDPYLSNETFSDIALEIEALIQENLTKIVELALRNHNA